MWEEYNILHKANTSTFMKIEHLIAQYLYTSKKVSLQDIGTFYLSADVVIPDTQDKEAVLPDNAIRFEYNPKTKQDDGLIDYIVQQTRKIKPLATSDLESFLILGKQFMNIGKPLPIGGLGVLQKNQAGQYEFIQGQSINTKIEQPATTLKEKDTEEIDFSSQPRKNNSRVYSIVAVLIFLVLAAGAAFYFVSKNNKNKKAEQILVADSDSVNAPTKKDTVQMQPPVIKDSTPLVSVPKTDSFTFKVVIREYTTQETSDNIYKKFTSYGHKLVQYAPDTSHFRIALAFKKPLSDTLKVKDSLRILFGGKPFIDIK